MLSKIMDAQFEWWSGPRANHGHIWSRQVDRKIKMPTEGEIN